jgi:NAD(P) transhydrogenase subunit alpha
MVATMRPGSAIVDLAAPSGGNCALTVPGEQVVVHGVTIAGPLNLPATMPVHASQLYSRNAATFVAHLLANGVALDAATGRVSINLDDEIVGNTCITADGRIVHAATLERAAVAREEKGQDGK